MDQPHQKDAASWGQLQERLSEPIRALYSRLTKRAQRQLGGGSDKRGVALPQAGGARVRKGCDKADDFLSSEKVA